MKIKYTRVIFSAIIITVFIISFLSLGTYVAYADNEEYVYIGGTPLGIVADSEYMIVSDLINVMTNRGSYSPAYNAGVRSGDIIVTVNGRKIYNVKELNDVVQSSDEIVLSVRRGETIFDIVIQPAYDLIFNQKKLGFNVKTDLMGIGTLTYVTRERRFGALGHVLSDAFNISNAYQSGFIYDCFVTGYNVATEEKPGEIRGKIKIDERIGTFDKNLFCGIFGQMDKEIDHKIYPVGHRSEVNPGKAQIYTTINGQTPEYYEIEIIKAVKQDKPSDKSMVIRVIDKELKKTTGGILQGMSGSPIVQNGKIIGAVTHVFTVDSTKGYGIYLDWMMQNN